VEKEEAKEKKLLSRGRRASISDLPALNTWAIWLLHDYTIKYMAQLSTVMDDFL
jgi:hypothetical protein